MIGQILPESQDPHYGQTKIEDVGRKYAQGIILAKQTYNLEELREKLVLDAVKVLVFSKERIKSVEEALAKYETVDEAMDKMRKLSLKTGS